MTDVRYVRDLMTVGVFTCPANTLVPDIARLMIEHGLEAVAVLDHEGHAVGMISQHELVQSYAREDCRSLTAEQIMREDIPQIPPDIPLTAAVQIMQDQGVRVLFLLHNSDGIQYPAALLSYRHVLRHLAAQDPSDLKDLGIHAQRESPLETFVRRRDEARQRALSQKKEE